MLFIFIILIQTITSLFIINSINVTPLTAQSNNTYYNYTFNNTDPTLTISNNYQFVIRFPDYIFNINAINNCKTYLNNIDITNNILCSAASNYVYITNIVNIQTNISNF